MVRPVRGENGNSERQRHNLDFVADVGDRFAEPEGTAAGVVRVFHRLGQRLRCWRLTAQGANGHGINGRQVNDREEEVNITNIDLISPSTTGRMEEGVN